MSAKGELATIHVTTAVSAAGKANLTTSLVRELLAEIRYLQQQPAAEWPVKLSTADAGIHILAC